MSIREVCPKCGKTQTGFDILFPCENCGYQLKLTEAGEKLKASLCEKEENK